MPAQPKPKPELSKFILRTCSTCGVELNRGRVGVCRKCAAAPPPTWESLDRPPDEPDAIDWNVLAEIRESKRVLPLDDPAAGLASHRFRRWGADQSPPREPRICRVLRQ